MSRPPDQTGRFALEELSSGVEARGGVEAAINANNLEALNEKPIPDVKPVI